MRPSIVITLVVLLVLIFGAAALQLFILAR
jgi:hypothetical protein